MTRRDALKLLAMTPFAGALGCTGDELERASRLVDGLPAGPYEPRFFTPGEYRTAGILADLVIPPDEKSGGALDARVPEFMDFILNESNERRQSTFRGGLAWIDAEAQRRFTVDFADAAAEQQAAILDDIAWPDRAPADLADGVSFFNAFRDLTAAGFFSSEIGWRDLEYMGDPVPDWNGCPEPALQKLGVSYDLMRRVV